MTEGFEKWFCNEEFPTTQRAKHNLKTVSRQSSVCKYLSSYDCISVHHQHLKLSKFTWNIAPYILIAVVKD